MDALTTLILGTIVSYVTQKSKKKFPNTNPLFFVSLLSVVGGLLYAFITPSIPADMLEKVVFSFTVAISMYEVLKKFMK